MATSLPSTAGMIFGSRTCGELREAGLEGQHEGPPVAELGAAHRQVGRDVTIELGVGRLHLGNQRGGSVAADGQRVVADLGAGVALHVAQVGKLLVRLHRVGVQRRGMTVDGLQGTDPEQPTTSSARTPTATAESTLTAIGRFRIQALASMELLLGSTGHGLHVVHRPRNRFLQAFSCQSLDARQAEPSVSRPSVGWAGADAPGWSTGCGRGSGERRGDVDRGQQQGRQQGRHAPAGSGADRRQRLGPLFGRLRGFGCGLTAGRVGVGRVECACAGSPGRSHRPSSPAWAEAALTMVTPLSAVRRCAAGRLLSPFSRS